MLRRAPRLLNQGWFQESGSHSRDSSRFVFLRDIQKRLSLVKRVRGAFAVGYSVCSIVPWLSAVVPEVLFLRVGGLIGLVVDGIGQLVLWGLSLVLRVVLFLLSGAPIEHVHCLAIRTCCLLLLVVFSTWESGLEGWAAVRGGVSQKKRDPHNH